MDDVLLELALCVEPADTRNAASQRRAMRKRPVAATTVAPKKAKATKSKAAKKGKTSDKKFRATTAGERGPTGLSMTWKCIYSRAYHGAIRQAKSQGLSGEEAKMLVAEAVARAKADISAGVVSS